MATIDTSVTTLFSIPNVKTEDYKLTNFSSATLLGTTLYSLKTCGDSKSLFPICIEKTTNWLTNPVTTNIPLKDTKGQPVELIAKHANGITGVGSCLYIATLNDKNDPQVLYFTTKGVLKKQYYYKKNGIGVKVHNIQYVGTENGYKKFIIGIGGVGGGRYGYDVVLLKGSTLEYTGVTIIGTVTTGWTANDIFYNAGKLYATFFSKDDNGIITYNKIFVYKTDLKKSAQLEPVDIITCNRPKRFDKKFELESFWIANKIWYAGGNTESTIKKYYKDFVMKLTKKK